MGKWSLVIALSVGVLGTPGRSTAQFPPGAGAPVLKPGPGQAPPTLPPAQAGGAPELPPFPVPAPGCGLPLAEGMPGACPGPEGFPAGPDCPPPGAGPAGPPCVPDSGLVCPPPCCPSGPCFYTGFEYLHWWFKQQPLPPLLTTGPFDPTSAAVPGALGDPNTQVLIDKV